MGEDDFDLLEIGLTASLAIVFVVFAASVGTRVTRRYSMHFERLHSGERPVPRGNAPDARPIRARWRNRPRCHHRRVSRGSYPGRGGRKLELQRQARPVYEFLTPFFFVIIGRTSISTRSPTRRYWRLRLATPCWQSQESSPRHAGIAGLHARSAAIVGVGMVPRGEVGLVVAGIGPGSARSRTICSRWSSS